MRRLPIFVLPTVLFPGSLLPLHVFEPRYRRMAARCLEMDRRFGVLFHDPDESGSFELREGVIGCEAEILKFEPLQDGRSLMLTRGIERYRVLDGIESDTLYTEALVESLHDAAPPADIADLRRITLERFDEALRRAGRDRESVPEIDASRDISFQIAQNFRIALAWQQRFLEMTAETLRLQEIERALEEG
jgi:Lon protease-like protein